MRQRRTVRSMQGLLVVAATGLLLFAGYSWGQRATSGMDEGDALEPRRVPGVAQVIVPALLGLGCCVAAITLQSEAGVRLLTPARLTEMQQQAPRADRSHGVGGTDEDPPPGQREESEAARSNQGSTSP